jgi:hypothetical protein
MIRFTNDVHRTSVNPRAEVGDVLTQSQVRRMFLELCADPYCPCGVICGSQPFGIAAKFCSNAVGSTVIRAVVAPSNRPGEQR